MRLRPPTRAPSERDARHDLPAGGDPGRARRLGPKNRPRSRWSRLPVHRVGGAAGSSGLATDPCDAGRRSRRARADATVPVGRRRQRVHPARSDRRSRRDRGHGRGGARRRRSPTGWPAAASMSSPPTPRSRPRSRASPRDSWAPGSTRSPRSSRPGTGSACHSLATPTMAPSGPGSRRAPVSGSPLPNARPSWSRAMTGPAGPATIRCSASPDPAAGRRPGTVRDPARGDRRAPRLPIRAPPGLPGLVDRGARRGSPHLPGGA